MHIGKDQSETLCKDLYLGEWKNEVVEDPLKGGMELDNALVEI